MQIGLLNHLNFPKGSNPLLAANAGDDSTAAADGSATPTPGAALPALTPAADAPGVILKLQGEAAIANASLAKGLVYSSGRKAAFSMDVGSDTKPQDFVTLAVSAMRDYADAQERLKSAAQSSESPFTASLIPRSLAEVQKLASRFKLFA